MARNKGLLTLDELGALVDAGEVDTIVVGFADMQGRLVGKRVSSRLFMEEVAPHGAECCNYLLAVDVEMNTVAGYAMSGWERGYGDMVMRPDLSTLRLTPWLPGSALVMADLEWHDGSPVAAAPRSILQRQVEFGLGQSPVAVVFQLELPFPQLCGCSEQLLQAIIRLFGIVYPIQQNALATGGDAGKENGIAVRSNA